MKRLDKLIVAWNVFSLYFSHNSWPGGNTDTANYKFSDSLIFMVNMGILLGIKNYLNSGLWGIFFVGAIFFPLIISLIYERKIKQGYYKFKEYGFSRYYFLFIIYVILGCLGFGKGFYDSIG